MFVEVGEVEAGVRLEDEDDDIPWLEVVVNGDSFPSLEPVRIYFCTSE